MKKITITPFTVSQFRGALVLASVLLVIGIISAITKFYLVPDLSQITIITTQAEERQPWQSSSKPDLCLDLNLADSAQLVSLPGIGPVLSGRILKFRKSKQGFDSVDDLREVYGLSPETFGRIESSLYIGFRPARKIKTVKKDDWKKPVRDFSMDKKWGKEVYPKNQPAQILDINLATEDELQGLPCIGKVLAARIIKFRKAVGGFHAINQLSEVYGLSDSAFLVIKPLVKLDTPVAKDGESRQKPRETQMSLPKTDLNEADSLDLVRVSGIGPKLASRILKYREQLGFYHSVSQLQEIWGMYPDNLERIQSQVTVKENLDEYPHLEINRVGEDELKKHPYLNWKEVRILVAYREFHGDYYDIEEVKKVSGIAPETIEKVGKYLKF
ncbi:MAG: helix-hairpin-helix domain-containing protein [Bacteroidia bacterium]|nr:helix-hairpin-helix domain-containing protein [Bacteroidia bacterium]